MQGAPWLMRFNFQGVHPGFRSLKFSVHLSSITLWMLPKSCSSNVRFCTSAFVVHPAFCSSTLRMHPGFWSLKIRISPTFSSLIFRMHPGFWRISIRVHPTFCSVHSWWSLYWKIEKQPRSVYSAHSGCLFLWDTHIRLRVDRIILKRIHTSEPQEANCDTQSDFTVQKYKNFNLTERDRLKTLTPYGTTVVPRQKKRDDYKKTRLNWMADFLNYRSLCTMLLIWSCQLSTAS